MNLPEINSYEEKAIDAVAFVLNKAKSKLGAHQSLQLAETRAELAPPSKLSLASVSPPIAIKSEKFITDTIERVWKLTANLQYDLKYKGCTTGETSVHYYFEAVFSQPTVQYPIPQATVSVFFAVEDKQHEPPKAPERPSPVMTFRIEGHYQDHDVRFVKLTSDWILALLQMKIKLFKRVEKLRLF